MSTATLAIIVKNGRVLLGYKKKGAEEISDIINGPGGKQEGGETLEGCAIRETYEEMGIRLIPEKLKKIAVIMFHAAGVPDFEVHVYWTDDFEGEPTETRTMIPAWHPANKLPLEQMIEGDRAWFAKAVSGEKFNANVFFKERAKNFERIEFLPFIDYPPR